MIAAFVAAAVMAQDMTLVPLSTGPSPAVNPYKGIVVNSGNESVEEATMELVALDLGMVLVGEDEYNWGPLDHRLDQARDANRHAVLHFNTYSDDPASALPVFLFNSIRSTDYQIDWPGPLNGQSARLADYNAFAYRLAVQKFIKVLGERYGTNPRIAFVSAGLLGTNGSWETPGSTGSMPEVAVQREIARSLKQAFPDAPVLVPVPGTDEDGYWASADAGVGYLDFRFAENTMFMGQPGSEDSFERRLQRAGATGVWRTQPIGGWTMTSIPPAPFEDSLESQGVQFGSGGALPEMQDVQEAARRLRASFVITGSAIVDRTEGELHASAKDLSELLGYEFRISQVSYVVEDGLFKFRIEFVNQGIAPLYHRVPMELAMLFEDGSIRTVLERNRLNEVMPGETEMIQYQLSLSNLGDPIKFIARMKPDGTNRAIQFANLEMNADVEGWITLLDVTDLW
jgi:hypothetical protein